jgi:hypothetical protein
VHYKNMVFKLLQTSNKNILKSMLSNKEKEIHIQQQLAAAAPPAQLPQPVIQLNPQQPVNLGLQAQLLAPPPPPPAPTPLPKPVVLLNPPQPVNLGLQAQLLQAQKEAQRQANIMARKQANTMARKLKTTQAPAPAPAPAAAAPAAAAPQAPATYNTKTSPNSGSSCY